MSSPGIMLRNTVRQMRSGAVLLAMALGALLLGACNETETPEPIDKTPAAQIRYLKHFGANGALLDNETATFRRAGIAALRWQAEAPDALLFWLQEATAWVNSPKYRMLLHALAGCACDSPETILQVYGSLPDESRDVFLYWSMLLRAQYAISEDDPRLIEKYLEQVPIARAYLDASPGLDFPLTARLLEKSPLPGQEKQGLTELLLIHWMDKENGAALAYLEKIDDLEALTYQTFLSKWVKLDPDAALAFGVKGNLSAGWSTESAGFESLIIMMEQWLQTDEFAALGWVDAQTDAQVKAILASALVSSSAQTDGLIASRYFTDIKDEATRMTMAPKIAKTLADRNPEAGLAWLVETAKSENRHKGFEQFYAHLARYDVGYAVELFPSDQAPMVQKEAADAIMESAHQVELDQVYDWLESIHPDASKGHAMAWNLKSYAAIDPVRVEKFLANHPEVRRLARPHLNLGLTWAVQEPEGAMAWVRDLPEGRGRSGAAYGVTEGLLKTNDQMALDWIDSLPPGMKRDWAVDALFDFNAELRPELVFEHALHVTGKHRRERYITKTIEVMKAQGKLNATEIWARDDIPDSDRAWLSDLLQ